MSSRGKRYQIRILREPEKFLERVPDNIRRRIEKAIDVLADEPRPAGVRKLKGFERLYRIRVGDWQVVYEIRDKILVIVIVEVGTRGDVYRGL
jgi:mRNA interferase RelE/StbE